MPKSIPISLRISEEDASFLAAIDIEGAITPSEKIRALIKESRTHYEAGNGSERITDQFHDQLRKLQENLLLSEREEKVHSEFLRFVLDWNAQFARSMLREAQTEELSKSEMEGLEEATAAQIFQLIDYIARLGVTPTAPCYNPKVIREKLLQHIDLLDLVETQVKKGKSNG